MSQLPKLYLRNTLLMIQSFTHRVVQWYSVDKGLHVSIARVAIELQMRSCESKAPYRGGKFVKRAPVVNITRKYARSKGIWEESNGLKWIGIPGYKIQLLLTTLSKNIRQLQKYKTNTKIHTNTNIARGTTDPWVDTITRGTLQLANLANRWHHMHMLEIQPQSGTTCISKKFGHQMAPFALVRNLATKWCHLHQ